MIVVCNAKFGCWVAVDEEAFALLDHLKGNTRQLWFRDEVNVLSAKPLSKYKIRTYVEILCFPCALHSDLPKEPCSRKAMVTSWSRERTSESYQRNPLGYFVCPPELLVV